jgi:hypothetical protein
MPNHITNVLRVNAYKHRGAPAGLIDEILESIKGEKTPFDFNRLIPMPRELDITSNGANDDAHLSNLAKYGHTDWSTWCREHWGTLTAPSLGSLMTKRPSFTSRPHGRRPCLCLTRWPRSSQRPTFA